MKSHELQQKLADKAVKVLDTFLRVEANSNSCIIMYQPKAPKELEKFKKKK